MVVHCAMMTQNCFTFPQIFYKLLSEKSTVPLDKNTCVILVVFFNYLLTYYLLNYSMEQIPC